MWWEAYVKENNPGGSRCQPAKAPSTNAKLYNLAFMSSNFMVKCAFIVVSSQCTNNRSGGEGASPHYKAASTMIIMLRTAAK
jgi:hypothetical protein